ncbi:uncharacterized protein GGS22DRAFT_160421 [Annulohypoxylon maeteangense]|uniref:uncharacterized protein n=1 Tax=Annulohypoxylon maeteangense TaxID=1927788 RepID=UPI00200804D3|nr:uncharacterized protein GGS22DRAFT_160421 [Annulohypoxylon maeteangense]KAI0886267.1 hypothetical protein GGS22DRAFT_160421 [Annulohypoxylon maeteangense]
MQFTTFIAAAAAVAFGANANVIPRDDARLGQFRVFGADGCSDLNYGFYTVDQSDANTCHEFTGVPASPGVKSVVLEGMYYPAANGCNFYIYTNNICTSGRRSLSVSSCNDVPPPNANWASWKMDCSSGSANGN